MKYAIWETRDYTKRLDEYGEVYRAAYQVIFALIVNVL